MVAADKAKSDPSPHRWFAGEDDNRPRFLARVAEDVFTRESFQKSGVKSPVKSNLTNEAHLESQDFHPYSPCNLVAIPKLRA